MHDCVIWRHMSSSLRLRASVTAVAFGRSKGIRQRSKTDLIITVRSRSECVSLIFNLPISEVVALRRGAWERRSGAGESVTEFNKSGNKSRKNLTTLNKIALQDSFFCIFNVMLFLLMATPISLEGGTDHAAETQRIYCVVVRPSLTHYLSKPNFGPYNFEGFGGRDVSFRKTIRRFPPSYLA